MSIFKKMFAFSLIELMISLITISCLTAAFTPVITKKLKNSATTINLDNLSTNCSTKFGSYCTLCDQKRCLSCYIPCGTNQFKDTNNCKCGDCSSKGAGCAICNSTNCISCKEGYGYNSTTHSCTLCAAGTYSDGSSPCAKCPKGQYQASSGKSYCDKANAGYYVATEGAKTQTACSAGTYQSLEGKDKCEPCKKGYAQPNTGQHACNQCGSGYYQPNTGQANCLECAAGTYSLSGAKESCSNCQAGTYQDAKHQSSCKSCPAGTWSSATKATSSSTCQKCVAGTWSSTTGATSSSTCTNCDAGKYSSAAGATSQSACVDCAAGKWSNTGASSCTLSCTAGYKCSGGVKTQCSAGTYSTAGSSNCTNCDAGKYSSSAGSTTCANCAAGKWSNAGSSSCTLSCPAGYRCSGGVKTQCSAGTFSTGGTSTCSNCSAGTYSGAGASGCTSCGQNTFASSAGASSCTSCETGKYSWSGASSCLSCSSAISNCTACAASGSSVTCSACASGYKVENNSCVSEFTCSGDNFMQVGNLCVTKRNMGDSTVLTIPSTVTITGGSSSGGCNATRCCWNGTTIVAANGYNYCSNNFNFYSGCTRTVCNYAAASEICAKFNYGGKTWRVPSSSDMGNWLLYTYNSSAGDYSGTNGLMLCGYAQDWDLSPHKLEKCMNGQRCGGSGGDSSRVCYVSNVWRQGGSYGLGNLTWQINSDTNGGRSVRCVTEMN